MFIFNKNFETRKREFRYFRYRYMFWICLLTHKLKSVTEKIMLFYAHSEKMILKNEIKNQAPLKKPQKETHTHTHTKSKTNMSKKKTTQEKDAVRGRKIWNILI